MLWEGIQIFRDPLRGFSILLFSYPVTIVLIHKPGQLISEKWHVHITETQPGRINERDGN